MSSFSLAQLGKSSPATIVKLRGAFNALSHTDIVAAVELFGKTKSVLFKSKQEVVMSVNAALLSSELPSLRVSVISIMGYHDQLVTGNEDFDV